MLVTLNRWLSALVLSASDTGSPAAPTSPSSSWGQWPAPGAPARLAAGPQALSWNGDRRAPFAYRAGQARPPDRPRTGPALSGRAHRAELLLPARVARRDDPVRADHRQARQHGDSYTVRAVPHRRRLRR